MSPRAVLPARLALSLILILTLPALARKPAAPPPTPDEVAGGQHWRLRTGAGAVHVWRPAGYLLRQAGVVVYVHGHNLDADGAWERFKLAEQFRSSRQNALFVVPGAPASSSEPVRWTSLNALLREVSRRTRQRLPAGHQVAIAHSGGYRTVVPWLENARLDHVILLDALYAAEPELQSWLTEGPRHLEHRLCLVGADTSRRTEAFLRRLPFAIRRRSIPDELGELTRRERRARLLYLASQYNHNAMVQNGKVIPLLLRLTRLRLLP